MFRKQTINKLIELESQKKKIDEELRVLKSNMIKSFKKKNERTFENDDVKITYVESFMRTYVDNEKLKEYPEIFSKVSYKKETGEKLRITLR